MSDFVRLEVRHEVTEQSIERDASGRWLLVARANDGFTWQVDVSGAVQAAAQHLRDETIQRLEEENERLQEWLEWYVERYGVPGG